MINLREYQIQGVEALRNKLKQGEKRIVFCSPTGSGKTVVFSYMCKNAVDRGSRVLILTDRIELLTSTHGTLSKFDLEPVKIEANNQIKKFDQQLYVAMVETISRRLASKKKGKQYKQFFKSLDLIIIDEAHKQAFNKLFKYVNDKTTIIGFTATPYRRKPQVAMSETYTSIVELVTIPELIDLGFLAVPNTYDYKVNLKGVGTKQGEFDPAGLHNAYEEQKVFQGVVQNYLAYSKGLKTIVFSASIEDSLQVRAEFERYSITAKHLDSTMSKKERGETLNWFMTTPDAVICNVGILTTGFDCPDIRTVILYRATKSLPLFLQMCGRGSRVTKDKHDFNILDFGGNIKRHGLWEDLREWTLELAAKSIKEGEAPVKECPNCMQIVHSACKTCPSIIGWDKNMKPKKCGYVFPVEVVEKVDQKGEVVKLTKAEAMIHNQSARKALQNNDIATVVDLIKTRKVKSFFVFHQLTDFKVADQIREALGYKPGFWHYNKERFPRLQ